MTTVENLFPQKQLNWPIFTKADSKACLSEMVSSLFNHNSFLKELVRQALRLPLTPFCGDCPWFSLSGVDPWRCSLFSDLFGIGTRWRSLFPFVLAMAPASSIFVVRRPFLVTLSRFVPTFRLLYLVYLTTEINPLSYVVQEAAGSSLTTTTSYHGSSSCKLMIKNLTSYPPQYYTRVLERTHWPGPFCTGVGRD